jgi:hypothetical protein
MFVFLKDGALKIPDKYAQYFNLEEISAIFGCPPEDFSSTVTMEELQNYIVVSALMNGESKSEIEEIRMSMPTFSQAR